MNDKAKRRHPEQPTNTTLEQRLSRSLMPFTTGQEVIEVIGNLENRGVARRVRIVSNDDDTCTTAAGNIYTRDTGKYVGPAKVKIYMGIHTPDYL